MTHILFFYAMSLCFQSWERDNAHIQITSTPASHVTFSISNAGIEVSGTLKVVIKEFNFDPLNLEKSTITASADPSTIMTGIAIRDKHLRRKDYFDVDQFSEILLRSVQFRKTGKNKFIGDFLLTIKNTTRAVKINFEAQRGNGRMSYSGTFQIDRIDFNVGEKSAILENVVSIAFDIVP